MEIGASKSRPPYWKEFRYTLTFSLTSSQKSAPLCRGAYAFRAAFPPVLFYDKFKQLFTKAKQPGLASAEDF